ncbi:kinesin light chain [Boeremia exigua]|uniref:kinesin light chain n=1 Tax=Boeremia exigua TaxID=749465 RepID=UPI001E8CBB6D|nr:kinesin light chain [Boeremia exigua]KAH6633755.1 kinesin light chain [Boeremia exigua]
MRLLHVDALDRLFLTDFRGKRTPPYAILSHRWSDSEILIEDLSNGAYRKKQEGYQKLRFCAEQAAKDGLQYFWIDTCCIDRWDNNERSKAINSMFEWYRNAARCYVFLSDVSLAAVTETATGSCSEWETSFCKSPWFTRGWTLQELIAPMSVEFFSHQGRRIGDKASLEQLIHGITSIPFTALRNEPLDQFSTSERMRWAVKRTTTEEEDIVYCLLGLLGISMPVTYGEGEKSARKRLQAEIEAAGSAPSIIPFSRNESFVGRESQLAQLEAKLFSNQETTTTLAIVGAGGMGKSQLALEVAHRVRLHKKDHSVFWMDASDVDSLHRSYASVAQKLNIPGCDDDQADIAEIVRQCVAVVSALQCLLIYDNVEGTFLRPGGSSPGEVADLADFLPPSRLCSVIFTTKESDRAVAFAPQNVIALHELTPDMALRMLHNRLTKPLSNAEQQDAMHLLSELLYLPLAIVQAAACMNASYMTVQQYRTQLAEHKEAALKISDNLPKGELRDPSLSDTVAATLSLSTSQIRRSNAAAADYLFVAACVDRKDIPLDLLAAASQAREDAIRLLDRYALVTRRPAESALDVHQLVHQGLRKQLQMQQRVQKWMECTIAQLLQIFPDNDYSNRSKWRRLLPHAQHVLSQSSIDYYDEAELDLALKCAMVLQRDGRFDQARELVAQVMQIRKQLLGNDHPDTLRSMHWLALMNSNVGRWQEAEELEVQVMQTWKRILGDEHPDTLLSMANLATYYYDQGRWQESEKLGLQVVLAKKRLLGDKHPGTLTSIHNLAVAYRCQGRWREAEELGVEVTQTFREVCGDEHPDTITSIGNLALTYTEQRRWQEAEELQLKVTKTRERVLGSEHPSSLASMHNLAVTYYNQGRWQETEKLGSWVLQTRTKVLGHRHPDTLASLHNVAVVLRSQARCTEAFTLMERCFHLRQHVLGTQHPDTELSLKTLSGWRIIDDG